MSDKGIMERLIAALDRNSDLLEKIGASGGKAADDKGGEERGSRRRSSDDGDKGSEETGRGRGRGRSRDDDKGDKEVSAEDFQKAVEKFVDVESDEEYNRRLDKCILPVLDKADVKEIKDLPAKYRQTVLDNIAEYEKAGSGGGRRRV